MDLTRLHLPPEQTHAVTAAILETVREALLVLDEDLRTVGANQAFYDAFQTTPEETAGRSVFALGTGQWDMEAIRTLLDGVAAEGAEVRGHEVTHDFPGLGVKTMRLSARRIVYGDSDGAPGFVVLLVLDDVTALQRAEEEVRVLHDELETRVRRRTHQLAAANEELEAFAYSVSHDLRAPLRALAGFSQALIEDYAGVLEGRGKEYLRHVQNAADQMSRLIDELLQLSRVTRAAMHYEAVDLSALARDLLEELAAQSPEREVAVAVEDGLVVTGDPVLLRTALWNLLDNAWKYTRHAPTPQVSFSSFSRDGETVYAVHDNGAGFDMAYMEKLFRPFERLHSAHEFEGNGIGLATVYRIIRRHGGRVWGEGTVGGGASLYFTLGTAERSTMPLS